MEDKRYRITITIEDLQTLHIEEHEFCAKRLTGAWRRVLEAVMKRFTANQIVTYMSKRYDIGYGYTTLLAAITLGEIDYKLIKEGD